MFRTILRAAVAVALAGSLLLAGTVRAHDEITAGDYTISYGWVNEPPVAGQPNGIEIHITQGETHGHDEPGTPAAGHGHVAGEIAIVSPADGAEIAGGAVEVTVAITGAEAGTHWHLYVDDALATMQALAEPSFVAPGLANGAHTLRAVLADAEHAEADTAATVAITVTGSGAQADANGATTGTIDVSGLQVALVYGGQTHVLALQPGSETGEFVGRVTPTRAGQYTLQFSGRLGDTEVSAEVEPEEVALDDPLAFPSPADGQTGQAGAAAARADTAVALGIAGVLLGLAGTGLAVAALLRRR
jgi:hypothetical protein